ncbi:MAG: hypothetical protein KRP56_05150 [Candidatus Methanogranum gryphiswaldense]|nr:MAG: hypothetical protein KRP56_05150 [Candidatus Methanogranum sp. U3.2.1]
MSTNVIAILAVILIAASAGGIYLMMDEESSSGTKVLYYDGDILIQEQNCSNVAVLEDIDSSLCTDRTFIGWSFSSTYAGELMLPGDTVDVSGEMRLYAVMVDGKISTSDDGIVSFDIGNADISEGMVIDLRSFSYVKQIVVSVDTVDAMEESGKTVRILLHDGKEIEFDASTVSDITDIVSDEPLNIMFEEFYNGMDFQIYSSDEELSDISGKIRMTIPVRVSSNHDMRVFGPSVGEGNTFDFIISEGKITFHSNELGYRMIYLFGLEVRDGKGLVLSEGHSDYPDITTYSMSFKTWGMFAKEDVFSISDAKAGFYYDVKGAVLGSDSTYTVSGNSKIFVDILAGVQKHRIILPDEQIGYTLTADPSEVSDGERCILSYTIKTGYVDDELIIKVNGDAVELDGMSRICIEDISSDQIVTLSGVYDIRSFDIVLPNDTVGYTITASSEKVSYGMSYELRFALLTDYEKGSNFKIRVNGDDLLDISSGTVKVYGVTATQNITVTGVQLKTYDITAGGHVRLIVNGYEASTATCKDVISILTYDGYVLPSNYGAYLPVTVHVSGSGYKVSDDSVFPGVSKITVGENIIVGSGGSRASFFVCSSEKVTISAVSGYSMPSNYSSVVSSMNGVSVFNDRYTFSEDISLPSVYKVTYLGYSSFVQTFCVIVGENVPSATSVPSRNYYEFDGWESHSSTVMDDMGINSIWVPTQYNVEFGEHITYTINGSTFNGIANKQLTIEDSIAIVPNFGYELPVNYLQSSFLVSENRGMGTVYHVTSDYEFKTVFRLIYSDNEDEISFYYSEGTSILLYQPGSNELVGLFEEMPATSFLGWYTIDNERYTQSYLVNGDNVLYARWSP